MTSGCYMRRHAPHALGHKQLYSHAFVALLNMTIIFHTIAVPVNVGCAGLDGAGDEESIRCVTLEHDRQTIEAYPFITDPAPSMIGSLVFDNENMNF
jgi:hypothetical protein